MTTTANSGAGSLRQAVLDNNTGGGGFICCSVTGTIVLTGGQLTLTKPVNITGPGANLLTVRANGNGRVF